MLRILHSLPRTHKLLMLPVATMVAVLGAHKVITVYQDFQREPRTLETIVIPLQIDANPGLPSLSLQSGPVGDALGIAEQALEAARHHPHTDDTPPLAPARAPGAPADAATAQLDSGTLHIAVVIGTIANGMASDTGMPAGDSVTPGHQTVQADTHAPRWETYTVQQGDTFAVVAQNHLGMGYSEVLRLLDDHPSPRTLTHWRPGATFDYQLDHEGRLAALRMMRNAREGFLIERADDSFEAATIERSGEATQRLFAGTVSGSFARSAQATGLSNAEISELTRVLGKQLDFRRDTRRGDSFRVLVESDVIDGASFDPRILAVQYEGERQELTLVRNPADNNFYTPDGDSLEPAFARYPFEGSYRISSGFNPNRRHPVTGRVSPHLGTDFAMPIGTPIVAPADGRVERVANHPIAGRYVVIRHDNGYQTRYLHLSRPLVSRGDRVTMGERIALSGNTGRSTGPHLHYEVLVNNTQVNAMTVDLPESQSLTGERLMAFQRQAEPLLLALENGQPGPMTVASRRDDRSSGSDRSDEG